MPHFGPVKRRELVNCLRRLGYSGPYAGFKGAVNFYREIDRMVNTKIWGLIPAPWDKEPQVTGTYGTD